MEMLSAFCSLWPCSLLGKDSALHTLLPGLRVLAWRDLLLHLGANPGEFRPVPAPPGLRLLQGEQVGVGPSCREPRRKWHLWVARRACVQPPVSPAAAAAPDTSSPASSVSQAHLPCHPKEPEPSPRSSIEGVPAAAAVMPAQPGGHDEALMCKGRGSEVTLVGDRPSPQAEEELRGSCRQCRAPWSLSCSDGFVSPPTRKTGVGWDQILEPLGAKAKDLGTGGFLARSKGEAICAL